MTIGLVSNVYNEAASLPGLISLAKTYFSDLFFLHCGPGGKYSSDGTIEILEKSGVRFKFANIDDGFGKIRTRLIHESKCDWVAILDADERFFPIVNVMEVSGDEKYPDTETPNVPCSVVGTGFNQGQLLKDMIDQAPSDCMAIRTCRRHWFCSPDEFTRGENLKPAQNWRKVEDWQLRVIRNDPRVFFLPERKMHEHLKWTPTWGEPPWRSGDTVHGPFVQDHFHFWSKSQSTEKNKEDLSTYQKLDLEGSKGMWTEHVVKTQSTENTL